MSLQARFELLRGPLLLDVDLEVAEGETVALLGPNGAGKTTSLHALAGLLRIDHGSIALGERVLDGGPAGPWVPPEGRGVGIVFQEHLLFPALSVLDNVAFGLRARGLTRRRAREVAAAWLARVGVADRQHDRPAALSGGQAQRVALARALATEPRILLLDEPLSAVDASAKIDLRRELRTHLKSFSGVRIVVAHDLGDALALADRLAVLEQGRVVQAGKIADVVARPASRYVADLVGLNAFHGTCRDGVVTLADGALVVASQEQGPVVVTFHPRAVALFRSRPSGSPRNVWSAPLVAVEPALDRVRVQLGGAVPVVAEVTPAAVNELGLDAGGDVWVAVKATEIAVAPA